MDFFPLKLLSSGECQEVATLEVKMTWTMLLVSCCYFAFVMPMCVLLAFDMDATLGAQLHTAALCVYVTQYSVNFLVYSLRSEQYRQAYYGFLSEIFYMLTHC